SHAFCLLTKLQLVDQNHIAVVEDKQNTSTQLNVKTNHVSLTRSLLASQPHGFSLAVYDRARAYRI
ncbi:hypothetical protein, partial [Streptomyces hilarionis]|uniref:hypothetical protein n=1 Tax=Streptomyces hilarionis TaxID=2839954 RepID=UPI00211A200E